MERLVAERRRRGQMTTAGRMICVRLATDRPPPLGDDTAFRSECSRHLERSCTRSFLIASTFLFRRDSENSRRYSSSPGHAFSPWRCSSSRRSVHAVLLKLLSSSGNSIALFDPSVLLPIRAVKTSSVCRVFRRWSLIVSRRGARGDTSATHVIISGVDFKEPAAKQTADPPDLARL